MLPPESRCVHFCPSVSTRQTGRRDDVQQAYTMHDKVCDRVCDKVYDQVHDQVYDTVYDKVYDKVCDRVCIKNFTLV